METSSLYIAAGTLLIAAGGLMATYGWDLRSSADTRTMLETRARHDLALRRAAMLNTLATECKLNATVLNHPSIEERNDEELKKHVFYPRLQQLGASSAVASGLFVTQQDKELYMAIINFQRVADTLNNRFTQVEIRFGSMLQAKGSVESIRKGLRDGPLLKQAKDQIAAIQDALKKYDKQGNFRTAGV